MDQFTNHFDVITGDSNRSEHTTARDLMNTVIDVLIKLGILKEDFDYHLIRAAMVIVFLFFGYQKWFEYETQVLIHYISNGPLIFWLHSVFGIRGATWFLGASEWTFGMLLFLGFWNKKLGILGALGSSVTFICTVTIIPFMPDGLGRFCRRLSGDDRTCRLFDERRRSLLRISLFAEAGCNESVESCQAKSRI